MSFANVVLWLAAANYFGAGNYALVLPVVNASLIQLEPGGIVALADLRCVYGGLRIGIGLFLAWLAYTGQTRLGLVGAGVLLGGNIFGRLVSLLADGVPESPGPIFLVFEIAGITLIATALSRSRVSLG